MTRRSSEAGTGRISLLKKQIRKECLHKNQGEKRPHNQKTDPLVWTPFCITHPACIHPCNSSQPLPAHKFSCLSLRSNSPSDMEGNVCNHQHKHSSASLSASYSRWIILLGLKCISVGVLKIHGGVLARVPKVWVHHLPSTDGKMA